MDYLMTLYRIKSLSYVLNVPVIVRKCVSPHRLLGP